jgi:hypothetical protein
VLTGHRPFRLTVPGQVDFGERFLHHLSLVHGPIDL